MEEGQIIKLFKEGKVGVTPTDTLLGILGKANDQIVVERIYKIRKRNPKKPCIILVSKINQLKKFGVKLNKKLISILEKIWPDKVTVILTLSFKLKELEYLHRGTNSLAFRLPRNKSLDNILVGTGPLIAPSANPEGKKPAKNIKEAKKYFGDKVDFYVSGKSSKTPSMIISITGDEINLIRGNERNFSRLKAKIGLK